MHQTLYRKYRPTDFDGVCGQDHITSVLKFEIANQRTAHAYLFCGSRGTGKTTCAKILAKAVNCETPIGGNPCCKCASCLSIEAGAVTDVLEMDAASNNGVDYIRDIRDEVVYTPAMVKKRVYIIDEVHMLSTSAFNALLKTLEEPPEHVVFILATTELHKLPSTIISRCQRFDFHRISVQLIADRLEYIAKTESLSLTREAAELLAKQAQGGMRDAISLFELCSNGAAVDEERVQSVLGLSSYARLAEVAKMIAEKRISDLFKVISELVVSSTDISVFWQELQSFYRDMMVSRYTDSPAQYLDLPMNDVKLLQETSSLFSMSALLQQASLLDTAYQNMLLSAQTRRMTAEITLIRMCDPKLDTSPEALMARIGDLEDKFTLLSVGNVSPAIAIMSEKTDSAAVSNTPNLSQETSVLKETPVLQVEETAAFTPVRDLSEIVERISRLNPPMKEFLSDCHFLVSPDGNSVRVETANEFAVIMLSSEANRKLLGESLAICKIASPGAVIDFVKVKTKATDPFADFQNF